TLPQAPQCWPSLSVATQAPLQSVVPSRQPQTPSVQICRAPQAIPHPPQFALSFIGSMQAEPQDSRPGAQSAAELTQPLNASAPTQARAIHRALEVEERVIREFLMVGVIILCGPLLPRRCVPGARGGTRGGEGDTRPGRGRGHR